jgi:4-hydroxy-tetrahydrodipicolinate reductase
MVKAIVAGAAGRMGGRIIHTIQQAEGISLGAAFERPDHPAVGRDVGEVVGLPPLGVKVAAGLASVLGAGDVVVDFTHHDATIGHLHQAAAARKPMVIGTTGFTAAEMETIRALARDIPCVQAPNMSMGVNLMFKVAADVARVLGEEYDVEIVETHHRFKKDAPSGTAVKLADCVAGALGRKMGDVGVYGRQGMVGERTRKEIGVFAVRAGDVVGEHTLVFGGIGERFEITHRAHSRDTFARGAVRAAAWALGKPAGLYDMASVLGI